MQPSKAQKANNMWLWTEMRKETRITWAHWLGWLHLHRRILWVSVLVSKIHTWSTPDVYMARCSQLLLSHGGCLTALYFLCLLCRISYSNSFNLWLKLFSWRVKVQPLICDQKKRNYPMPTRHEDCFCSCKRNLSLSLRFIWNPVHPTSGH